MTDEVPGTIVDLDNAPATPPAHSRAFAWDRAIRLYDTDFDRDRKVQVEYEFQGKTFKAREAERWPFTYDDTPPPVVPPLQIVPLAWIPPTSEVFTLASVLPEGTQYIRPDLLQNAPSFPPALFTVDEPPQTVVLLSLTNTSTVHAPTIAVANITIFLDHFTNEPNNDHQPTIVPGPVTIAPDYFANVAVIPDLADVTSVFPPQDLSDIGGIASTTTIYAPTVVPGAVTISLDHLANASTFPSPTVQAGVSFISDVGNLVNTSTVYSPAVVPGVRVAAVDTIASTAQVFNPTVVPGAVTISLDHLMNTSSLYSPSVTQPATGISFVGAATAAATSITIPTHQAGDLIVIFAFRDGSTTAPTVPAGWFVPPNSTTSVTGCSAAIAYKFATSSSEASGTWTNATHLSVAVYRGIAANTGFAQFTFGTGTTNSLSYPAQSNWIRTDSTSWALRFLGHVNANATATAPTGYTNRADFGSGGSARVAVHDSNGTVNSVSAGAVTSTGTAGGWIACTVELIASYTLGSELVTNAGFDTNTTGWTLSGNWARITSPSPSLSNVGGGGGGYAYWSTGMSQNDVVEVSWDSYSDEGQINVVVQQFAGMNREGRTYTTQRNYIITRLNTATPQICFQGGGAYVIDNISIKKLV